MKEQLFDNIHVAFQHMLNESTRLERVVEELWEEIDAKNKMLKQVARDLKVYGVKMSPEGRVTAEMQEDRTVNRNIVYGE